MAYKSRVSNKYFGSTFAGRVATSNENPLTDVVKVLRTQFTPAMENYADKYIEGKKTSADTYLSGYYATGGTPEKLNELIELKVTSSPSITLEFASATALGLSCSNNADPLPVSDPLNSRA